MATAVFTTVEARVNQQLTNAIWLDEIQDNINALAGAHANLLTNPGFEQWQRGVGPFTTTATYTADRWLLNENGSTCQVDRETTIVDGSGASLKFGISAFSGNPTLVQRLEDLTQLRGKTLSLSVRCQQSVASRVTATITDNATGAVSATSATTGSFVTLTTSFTVAAGATYIEVQFQFNGTGTFYFDNAMLVLGPAPAPYRPLHPQEDLARCQRYYEVHGGVAAGGPVVRGIATAISQDAGMWIPFAVPKYGLPTVTKVGTWAVANCGQPAVGKITPHGYEITITSSAAGVMSAAPNSTDDLVEAISNP